MPILEEVEKEKDKDKDKDKAEDDEAFVVAFEEAFAEEHRRDTEMGILRMVDMGA